MILKLAYHDNSENLKKTKKIDSTKSKFNGCAHDTISTDTSLSLN